MGQPNPPGDMPLFEGLGTEWNDIVGAFPEDKRAELAPLLKERISNYENQLKSYEPWADFQKSGITPEIADTALKVYSVIENDPKQVYEAIGKSLGLTQAEVKEVAQDLKVNGPADDPRLAALQKQVETMSHIMVGNHNQSLQEQQAAQAEAEIDAELDALKKKYGSEYPENDDEILMRMLHKNMTADEAFQEYSNRVTALRRSRPAPQILGSGGAIPGRAIDPTKLDSKGTKNLVAQMLDHANQAARN